MPKRLSKCSSIVLCRDAVMCTKIKWVKSELICVEVHGIPYENWQRSLPEIRLHVTLSFLGDAACVLQNNISHSLHSSKSRDIISY